MRNSHRSRVEWVTPKGDAFQWQHVQIELLMDIRDELQAISQKLSVLQCPNFIAIPRKLDRIGRNTAKKRKPKATGKPKLRVVR